MFPRDPQSDVFSSVVLFSLLVAEAEVGVPRQDVHIAITTEHESAAGLQPIIGRYSVWFEFYLGVV